jgi:hypothetical protein
MGGSSWVTGRPTLPALVVAIAAVLGPGLGGCGETEEPEISVTRGPAPPAGDLIQTSATVLPDEGFTTLATTTAQSRGGEALVFGLVLLKSGQPDLRLTINGKPTREVETRLFQSDAGTVATIFCACELVVGESDISLEAVGSARVGARSIDAFTAAALEKVPSSEVISAASVEDQPVDVISSGKTLVSARIENDAEKLIVLGSFRSDAESSASPDVVRTEGLLDGEPMDEIGSATLPGGKIAVFFSPSGARAGSEVELRGFVTAGHAPVTVSTLAACPCDLEQ